MEVRLIAGRGIPHYPFWKVVVAGDRAVVADLPCKGEGSENLYYHEGLTDQLRARHPDLGDARVSPGWLRRDGDEVVAQFLYGGVIADDAVRIAEALSDWCAAAGVDSLAIVDPGLGGAGKDDWDLVV
jgi:hypothetical protein